MPARPTQLKLGELAVQRGLVSREQLAETLQELNVRKAAGSQVPVGEVLVELGYLTRSQLEMLLAAQGKAQKPGATIPGFELIKKLGEGGMGSTYLARQVSMDRLVALKVLRKQFYRDEQFVARFRREAQVAGKLDHINIVQAIDVCHVVGRHFLVMEYVPGKCLTEFITKKGMKEDSALNVVVQLACALEHAHKHGIVHRDIKPDNVLLTAKFIAKLCDFGLARQTDRATRLTRTGMAMGTPHYISPEQARGEADVDVRSDIYSLGGTLYHMLTGRPPFSGTSAAVIMTRHITEQVPWPQDVNPRVSDNCCVLIEKMMTKDREERYQTPAELLHDLELVIEGRAPECRTPDLGMSSIARRGAMPPPRRAATSQPRKSSRPAAGRRRGAGSRDIADTAAGHPLQAVGEKLRLPMPVLAGICACVLALIGAGTYVLIHAGGATPGGAPPTGVTGNGAPPGGPTSSAAQLREKRKRLEKEFAEAQKWWKEHPSEFAGARRRFLKIQLEATGLVAMQVEDAIREVDAAETRAAADPPGVIPPRKK
jgi:serine/threonine-protein kinase